MEENLNEGKNDIFYPHSVQIFKILHFKNVKTINTFYC